MPFVEDNDLIEHVATDTSDEPLAGGILPRRSRRNLHFFDAPRADSRLKSRAVDRVAIPQEIAWCFIPGKGIDDLLCRPLCGGVLGDVEMHDAASLVG